MSLSGYLPESECYEERVGASIRISVIFKVILYSNSKFNI